MKARDIIPGWPRGRTTDRGESLGVLRWARYWGLRGMYFSTSDLRQSAAQRLHELDERIAYHAGQQAMVNAYFEQWRLRYPNPQRNWFMEIVKCPLLRHSSLEASRERGTAGTAEAGTNQSGVGAALSEDRIVERVDVALDNE